MIKSTIKEKEPKKFHYPVLLQNKHDEKVILVVNEDPKGVLNTYVVSAGNAKSLATIGDHYRFDLNDSIFHMSYEIFDGIVELSNGKIK